MPSPHDTRTIEIDALATTTPGRFVTLEAYYCAGTRSLARGFYLRARAVEMKGDGMVKWSPFSPGGMGARSLVRPASRYSARALADVADAADGPALEARRQLAADVAAAAGLELAGDADPAGEELDGIRAIGADVGRRSGSLLSLVRSPYAAGTPRDAAWQAGFSAARTAAAEPATTAAA